MRTANAEASAPVGRRLTLRQRIRVARRIMALLGLLLVCVCAYYLAAPFTRHNPVPRLFLGSALRAAGARLNVQGDLASPRTFLVANHISWLDILALTGATGSAFVAHAGLAQVRALRWLCGLNRTVFVARHDRAAVDEQIDQVSAALDDVGVLTIFPEGTTADGTALLPFKSSLLAALERASHDVSVQPAWLEYGDATAEIAWVGAEPGIANFLRVLARDRPIEATVHLLPALTADQARDRKAIAANARAAIADRLAQRVAL